MDSALDSDNGLAVHPDKDAAIQVAGAAGAAFATEEQLSEATALWPASRLVELWNGFAGAPPFAELKEVKRFTDRKSAVTRIWNAAQRLPDLPSRATHGLDAAQLRDGKNGREGRSQDRYVR